MNGPSRPSGMPAELLRDALRRDAPQREMVAARLEASLAAILLALGLVLLAIRGRPEITLMFAGVLVPFLVYAALVHRALARGWFWRHLPLLSTFVELLALGAATAIDLHLHGGVSVLTSPILVLWGAVIALTSVRLEPRICAFAGAFAAAAWIGFYVAVAHDLPRERVFALTALGAFLRAAFLLLAGGLGAYLARYFVERAEKALRDIREQDLFGKYLLETPLAAGGMGEVLRATYCPEGGFSRLVAVKRIRAELASEPKFVRAFCDEAALCATLHHPNIVQVLDFGRFRGAFMLAMEYVDGVSLSKLLRARGGPLELPAVALLGAEIAAALDYIHSRRSAQGAPLGLVHCDVNPPNVLVSRLGEVKLADFGIARAMGHLELDGHFHGKPAYAAPEQTFGTPLDGRTDLFALGITLHEAVTGKRLFAGMVDFASLLDVPSPSLVRPIPKGLEDVIMSLLEIEPERRPRSAGEVRDALLALGGECAPYPDGERLLASAVESCLDEVVGDRPGDATTRAEVTQGGGAPTSIHSRS